MSRDIARFARSRPVIECAQCGERVYIPNGPNVSTGAGCGTCGNATRAEPLLRPRSVSRWRNYGARLLGATPTHVNLRKIYVRAAIVRP